MPDHTTESTPADKACRLDRPVGRPVTYGPLQPPYAMPADLAEYVLSHLISERANLDGFLALGNERPRAKRLDRWIDALTPNVRANRPSGAAQE